MNIIDLLNIMLKRKWISIIGLFAPILITIITLLIIDSVYTGEAILKIGKFRNYGWLEEPNDLSVRLKSIYPNIRNIDYNKGDIIKIVISEKSPDEVLTSIEKIVNLIIKDHDIKLTSIKSEMQDNKKIVEEKIDKQTYIYNEKHKLLNMVNKKLEMLNGFVKKQLDPRNSFDKRHFIQSEEEQNLTSIPYEGWLLKTKTDILKELSNDEITLITLSAEKTKVQKKLSEIEMAHTRLLFQPTKPIKIKPNIKAYLVLGFISGLFLSIFMPITVDFLMNQKRNQ